MKVSIKTFDARVDHIVVCIRCVKVLLRCGKHHHLCVFPTTHHQSHDLVRRLLSAAAFRKDAHTGQASDTACIAGCCAREASHDAKQTAREDSTRSSHEK